MQGNPVSYIDRGRDERETERRYGEYDGRRWDYGQRDRSTRQHTTAATPHLVQRLCCSVGLCGLGQDTVSGSRRLNELYGFKNLKQMNYALRSAIFERRGRRDNR